MNSVRLDDGLMLRTAFSDWYEELVRQRRLFEHFYDLFALALVVGAVRNRKSSARPTSDIIRLDRVRAETRLTIEIVAGFLSQGKEERNLWNEVLAYADGGLELLSQEVQTLGGLDLLRLLVEAKEKWPTRLAELIPQLELPQGQAT